MKTVLNVITDTMSALYQGIFHKRNVIIVSAREVKHVPVSSTLQLLVVGCVAMGICWAGYLTGSYFSARHTIEKQSLTLKSVVGSKVENSFALTTDPNLSSHPASKAALSGVDNASLFARITELENKLKESQQNQSEFIKKVQKRTGDQIATLESLIQNTGLDVDKLKADAPKKARAKEEADAKSNMGGPYVPENILEIDRQESQAISKIDELTVLKSIVGTLPVASPITGKEMSPFGRRIDPITGRLAYHAGLDISGASGSHIRATGDGVVSFAGYKGAYGYSVDINHGFEISTRYAHMSQMLVTEGQRVKRGDIIGIQGSTGRSTGAHLHYEVHVRGEAVDPKNFLKAGRYVHKI